MQYHENFAVKTSCNFFPICAILVELSRLSGRGEANFWKYDYVADKHTVGTNI